MFWSPCVVVVVVIKDERTINVVRGKNELAFCRQKINGFFKYFKWPKNI